jgi:endoglycosylceramidase
MARDFWTRDGWIIDAHGRARIFHGANVSGRAKLPPFLALKEPDLLDPLRAWGWNLVRLVIPWEAVEPEPGKYDDAYLTAMTDLARACHARGLFTIVDFHQDLYARQYGGDGAPAWALPSGTGGPRFTGRWWFANYFFCRDLIRAEQAFWRNTGGIQDRYHDMLAHVAGRFAKAPGVLGYDLMNEPMGSPAGVLLGRFERRTLAVFQERGIAAVRKADPDRLVLIEPEPLVGFGYPCFLRAPQAEGLVFAPHLYDPVAIATGSFRRAISTSSYAVSRLSTQGRRLGMPVLIGEFGVLNGHARGRELLAAQVSALDARFFSWAAWHYNPSDVDWNDEDASLVTPRGKEREFMAPLVRPFARAVAGRPTRGRWNARAHRFDFGYVPDPACTAATEIAIPHRCFAEGASIVVEGADWTKDTASGETLFILPGSDAREVRVSVAG